MPRATGGCEGRPGCAGCRGFARLLFGGEHGAEDCASGALKKFFVFGDAEGTEVSRVAQLSVICLEMPRVRRKVRRY